MGAATKLAKQLGKTMPSALRITQEGQGAPLLLQFSAALSAEQAQLVCQALQEEFENHIAHCDPNEVYPSFIEVHLSSYEMHEGVLARVHQMLRPVQPGVIVIVYYDADPTVATWTVHPVLQFPEGFRREVMDWHGQVGQGSGVSIIKTESQRVIGRVIGSQAQFVSQIAGNFCAALNLHIVRTAHNRAFKM